MNNKQNTQPTITPLSTEDVMSALGFQKETDLSTFKTVSEKIRHLTGLGKTRSEIAKTLNIRYQHVRNVQLQVLKKSGNK